MSKGVTCPPGNVAKYFLCCKCCCLKSQYTKYLCNILRICRQHGGFAARPPSGLCPRTTMGDFRASDPLNAHPWKKSRGRPRGELHLRNNLPRVERDVGLRPLSHWRSRNEDESKSTITVETDADSELILSRQQCLGYWLQFGSGRCTTTMTSRDKSIRCPMSRVLPVREV